MVKYTCSKCLKDFTQKSHYDKHNIKKTQCNNTIEKLELLINKAVDNKLNNILTKKLN